MPGESPPCTTEPFLTLHPPPTVELVEQHSLPPLFEPILHANVLALNVSLAVAWSSIRLKISPLILQKPSLR